METLAEQLGTTTHLSPLLMKARRLGLREPEDFEKLAIVRGCRYYDTRCEYDSLKENAQFHVSLNTFGNAELGIALLSPNLPESQMRIRMAAAILASRTVRADEVVELAEQEGCGSMLSYIAACGNEVEPDERFWTNVLARSEHGDEGLPYRPHPTRFVEMTGITRGRIATLKRWIRPLGE